MRYNMRILQMKSKCVIIVRRVSQLANKPISKELKDQLYSIINNGESLDLSSIQRMLG